MNERIRIREVRLIDEDGTQLGVLLTRDALEIAREKGLDLVEVQPNAVPPVCRLMDYGRFRYEESRKERESRKKAKGAALKEVRLAPKIDGHDLETKIRQAQRFIEAGDKVKISVLFRGREMMHQDIGRNLLERTIEKLQPIASVDQDPRMEGRTMAILLSPKPHVLQALQQKADAASKADAAARDEEPVSADSSASD